MKISNFKLKFQASQITDFDSPIIIDKIITTLQNKKYQISEVTDKGIKFGFNPFKLAWNFKAPYILDEGCFEIIKSDQGTVVILNYSINILYFFLFLTTFIIFLLIQNEYFVMLFFSIVFLIIGVSQYTITQNVGKELLKEVLTEN